MNIKNILGTGLIIGAFVIPNSSLAFGIGISLSGNGTLSSIFAAPNTILQKIQNRQNDNDKQKDTISEHQHIELSRRSEKRGIVSINFDDGNRDAFERGMPIINRARFKTTHYIVTNRIGKPGFLTSSEIRMLHAQGHEIGAHTRAHLDLTKLSKKDMENEIDGSKSDLRKLGVGPVRTFAYPFGAVNNNVKKALHRSDFNHGRGTAIGINMNTTDRMNLKSHSLKNTTSFDEIRSRIDEAVTNKGWYIITIHHIDNGTEYSISSTMLQQIVDYLTANNVRVVTNNEGVNALYR